MLELSDIERAVIPEYDAWLFATKLATTFGEKYFELSDILTEEFVPFIWCIPDETKGSPDDRRIRFPSLKIMRSERGSRTRILLLGELITTQPKILRLGTVVVKYKSQVVDKENALYDSMKIVGCPLPWFSTSFQIFSTRLFVREDLETLLPEHYEYYRSIGIAILEQLRYVHVLCVHNNIKPENIRFRKTDTLANDEMVEVRRYFLIDFDTAAVKRKKYGYVRSARTPRYASQPALSGPITTYVNDLIELGYVLQHMKTDGVLVKTNFTEELATYMYLVKELNPQVERDVTIYDRLQTCLRNSLIDGYRQAELLNLSLAK